MDGEQILTGLRDRVSLLLYLNDCFVDLVRIDDYLYYINTMDHVYDTWKDHSHCTTNYRLPEDFSPCLGPLPHSENIDSHQSGADDPIIFTICHYWKYGLDFAYFDIGANYGMTAIPVAGFIRRMGRRNACIAMEPGVAGNLLRYSVELNGLADILTVDLRAADIRTGTVLIHSRTGHSAGDSISRIHEEQAGILTRSTVVRSVKLDDMMVDYHGIIAKIDTEGNDFRVLRGMKRTIEEKDVCILFELNPALCADTSNIHEELVHLHDWFELYSIYPDPPKDSPLSVIHRVDSVAPLIHLVRSTPRGWVDILAIKRTLPEFAAFKNRFEQQFRTRELS